MKCLLLEGVKKVVFKEYSVPEVGNDDVLVKIVSNIHKTIYKYTIERHVLNFTDKLYKIIDIENQKKC